MRKLFSFKRLLLTLALVFSVFVLIGCTPDVVSDADGVVTIKVINYEEELVFDKEVEFLVGDTLKELLQNHKELTVEGSTSEYGFFISSIMGIKDTDYEEVFWSFQVNGVDSLVGVSGTALKDKDVYTFSLISYSQDDDSVVNAVTIIVIDSELKEVFNEEIEFTEDNTLEVIMKNHDALAIKGIDYSFGFFITTIAGIEAGSTEFWFVEINGVGAMVGISEIELVDKDVYTFTLTQFG